MNRKVLVFSQILFESKLYIVITFKPSIWDRQSSFRLLLILWKFSQTSGLSLNILHLSWGRLLITRYRFVAVLGECITQHLTPRCCFKSLFANAECIQALKIKIITNEQNRYLPNLRKGITLDRRKLILKEDQISNKHF